MIGRRFAVLFMRCALIRCTTTGGVSKMNGEKRVTHRNDVTCDPNSQRLLTHSYAHFRLIEDFGIATRRVNNLADQISTLELPSINLICTTSLEAPLLCRETPLMRPLKLELILGAKVSPRVAIRSKWALPRSIQSGHESTSIAVYVRAGERRRNDGGEEVGRWGGIGFPPN